MDPLVSVIIPSFNRFDNLLNAIKSVSDQSYENIEVIVINDGSSDKIYKNNTFGDFVKLINLDRNSVQTKGYFSDSIRNYGIEESNGKYIAFLDDDDYWLPNKINLQVDKLENSNFGMVCSDALAGVGKYDENKKYKLYNNEILYNEISNIYKNSKLKNQFRKYFFYKFQFPEVWNINFLKVHNCILTSSLVVEKKLIEKIGGFRDIQTKKHYSDYDCWIGLLTHTDCYYFKQPLLHYDISDGMNVNTK